jgi:hypothetical protein
VRYNLLLQCKNRFKTEKQKVKAGTNFSIPTTFSDYKDVAGVKMPYTITVSQMGMDMTMDVKSTKLTRLKILTKH